MMEYWVLGKWESGILATFLLAGSKKYSYMGKVLSKNSIPVFHV
jgi:hypothetical protein